MTWRTRLCGWVLGGLIAHASALSLGAIAAAQTAGDAQPGLTAPLQIAPVTRSEDGAPNVVLSPPIAVQMPPATSEPAPVEPSAARFRSTPLPLPARPAQTNSQSTPLRLDDLAASSTAEARVYFHYSTLEEGGEATARQYAHHVLDNGFLSIEIRPVNVPIKTATIRYFYEDDRSESVRLSKALATPGRGLPDISYSVVDFVRFTPKPRKGTVEVWIPNDVRVGPARTDVSARPESPRPPATAVR